MTRIWLAATTALTMMAGVAMAQTTTETTTTESTTPYIAPVPAPVTETTTQRTVDDNGVVTDHSKTVVRGASITPYGDTVTTKKTIETTTTH